MLIGLVAGLFPGALGVARAAELPGVDRPNIILVFADDISARELPVYGASVWSHPERGANSTDPLHLAKTPVLDRLAEEGCWVTNAWASVVCSPSRAMMMTGRYAHQHKWWTNKDLGQVQRPNGKRETWPLYESSPLQLGHLAQQAGYGTFWSGKTQMPGDLRRYGFDEGCFTPGTLADKDNPYTDFKHVFRKVDGKRLLFNVDTNEPAQTYMQHGWYWYPHVRLMKHPSIEDGKDFGWWPNTEASRKAFGPATYGPDVELDFIFEFMDRKHEEGKPFFIYHTSHLGHDAYNWLNPEDPSKWPGTPVIEWDGERYHRKAVKITGDQGVYDTHGTVTESGMHRHVEYLDYQMWLYQQKLEEMGIADNTILIFCADNGTSGYGKQSSDRQKGTHVPLIIYAPGMTKQGAQDVLVNLSDFLPTFADIVGVPIPADYPIDGQSLWSYLMTPQDHHRAWIYGYKGPEQFVRGQYVMKDGWGRWYDVTEEPTDLISYREIKDWGKESGTHQAERQALEAVIAPFDLHATEHDAPGTPPAPKKPSKKAKKAANKPA